MVLFSASKMPFYGYQTSLFLFGLYACVYIGIACVYNCTCIYRMRLSRVRACTYTSYIHELMHAYNVDSP